MTTNNEMLIATRNEDLCMNGYRDALIENIERVRVKIKRILDASNYFEPLGYREYSSLVDLINHQETLLQQVKNARYSSLLKE